MNAQPIFKVIEYSRKSVNSNETTNDSDIRYFRVIFANNSNGDLSYPLISPKIGFDTLKAIKELLLLEGDIRLCAFPVINYCPARSQLYRGSCRNYSIQVEALFIINQLVFRAPFIYSSFPILVDRNTNIESSISGSIKKKTFTAYKKWYKRIQKKHIVLINIEEDD